MIGAYDRRSGHDLKILASINIIPTNRNSFTHSLQQDIFTINDIREQGNYECVPNPSRLSSEIVSPRRAYPQHGFNRQQLLTEKSGARCESAVFTQKSKNIL
ncbi:hypothetical protein [Chamaesiphon sp. VAR_48_metabat_135_sub]|uniref:hypothetical protein n=1 Tax=Chamaesiphon sp. VAR_48_metabat_135_sub TaxID=2964699 RepID=UPI00286B84B4|nr:hypothetical protein [Chamaesiphon sp. VAR_48_metabat_135_sub]